MDLGLGGSVAVVTGASKGIGLAVVRALAAEGAAVVAGARSVDALADLGGITAVEVDPARPGGPEQLVGHAVERHGRIDVLVNIVGAVRPRLDGFLATSDADFEASLQINFFAALRATRAAVTDMFARGEGTIVNVVSVNAFFQPDGLVIDYGAAKAALPNVAKALSQELGPKGIRINSVSPGQVETDLWLRDHGVAASVGRATGADGASRPRRRSPPAGSARPRRWRRWWPARLAQHGQRHRRQLRHRRRTRQDAVSVTRTPTRKVSPGHRHRRRPIGRRLAAGWSGVVLAPPDAVTSPRVGDAERVK